MTTDESTNPATSKLGLSKGAAQILTLNLPTRSAGASRLRALLTLPTYRQLASQLVSQSVVDS